MSTEKEVAIQVAQGKKQREITEEIKDLIEYVIEPVKRNDIEFVNIYASLFHPDFKNKTHTKIIACSADKVFWDNPEHQNGWKDDIAYKFAHYILKGRGTYIEHPDYPEDPNEPDPWITDKE